MKQTDRIKLVIGMVLLFGGLNLTILLSHLSRLYGVALVFAGIGIILWAAGGIERGRTPKAAEKKSLATSIIHILTFNGRFRDALPIAGIGILSLVAVFNLLVSENSYLGSNDYVAIFLAGVLISYNLVPGKYSVERDFALLFSVLLFFLLVVPTTILQLTSTGEDTNSPITYYLLAMPTTAFVNLLGISAESVGYNVIRIIGPEGEAMNLSIALSCSGLYSVAIFVSAFFAFVAVEYKKFDRKVMLLLGIGIFLAWIANIIRMSIIVVVGKYYGGDTMEWVHNNIGELIFMAWVTLFWLFMFRYFGVLEAKDDKAKPAGTRPMRAGKGRCAVCKEPLSPSIPSTRCECGAISHSGCILTNGMRCPSCGIHLELGKKAKG